MQGLGYNYNYLQFVLDLKDSVLSKSEQFAQLFLLRTLNLGDLDHL